MPILFHDHEELKNNHGENVPSFQTNFRAATRSQANVPMSRLRPGVVSRGPYWQYVRRDLEAE